MPTFKDVAAATAAAQAFADEVMRPAGLALDAMPDPAATVAPDSPVWEVHREYRRRGLHRFGLPGAFGGRELPSMAHSPMAQAYGHGDAGLAISLAACGMPFTMMALSPDAEVRGWARAYAEDLDATMVGCWGITEPAHGSDWVLGTTPAGANPKTAPSLRAVAAGDHYVLNGQKSAWVSNGTLATHAVLHVGLDPARGMHGSGIAFCPLDLPGISKGPPLDKVGQRPLNQGEIFFDNVELPARYMLIGNPSVFATDGVGRNFLGRANLETGTIMAGLARAAFDETLTRCRESGRFDEPAARIRLFELFGKVEAAAALAEHAARSSGEGRSAGLLGRLVANRASFALGTRAMKWFIDNYDELKERPWVKRYTEPGPPRTGLRSGVYGIACKVQCTQTAFDVASEGMQLVGQATLEARDPLNKMFRDARASLIEDGTNEALSLAGAEDL